MEQERGNDIRWVKPAAGFVVKSKIVESKQKAFINICTSPEIQAASYTLAGKGQQWSIPYSLSQPREDKDKGKVIPER